MQTTSLSGSERWSWNLTFFISGIVIAGSFALLNNPKGRPLLKFCFNSRDQFVVGQCVLCDFYQFSATVLGCNGRTSALMSNITSAEAVCIISNCLQQVRQAQPQFTGRKKRDATNDFVKSSAVEDDPKLDIQQTLDEEDEILDEAKELQEAVPSMKDFMNRYKILENEVRDLEEQVVDTIEVNVEEGDWDYE